MNNLKYEEISTSNGLSNDDITQILQDKRGMMWFSTSDGLNSYDGYEIKTYKGPIGREMTRDIRNARISPNNEIYLFNGKGTFVFSTLTKKFKVYKVPEGLAKNGQRVDDIIFNNDGGQWLFSNKRPNINYYKDGKITSYECYPLDIGGIRGFKDSKGNIWVYSSYVGLYGSDWNYPSYAGLYKFDAIRKRVDTIDFTPFGITNRISTLTEDNKGNIWVCGWYWGAMLIKGGDIKMGKIDGHLFTPKDLTPIMQSEEFFPRSVEFDPWRNCVHIGKSRGYTTIKVQQNNTDSFKITEHVPDFNTAEGLHANTITNFFTDREGILWLGSKAEGVQKLDYKKRKFIPVSAKDFTNLRFANVYSIFPFAENKYLVGIENSKLGVYDPYTNKVTSYLKHEMLQPLHEGYLNVSYSMVKARVNNKNTIYFGTRYRGLWIVYCDEKWGKVESVFKIFWNGGELNNTNTVWPIENNTSLVGCNNGLALLKIAETRNTLTQEDIEYFFIQLKGNDGLNSNIRYIYKDSKGVYWIAPVKNGLFKILDFNNFKPENIEYKHYETDIETPGELRSIDVQTIFEDSRGRLWIGGIDAGLMRYDRKKDKFVMFTEEEGWPCHSVFSILEDNQGMIWVGTNMGLIKFDPSLPLKEGLVRYSTEDGLPGNVFIANACVKDDEGYLLFGGYKGLNRFNPEKIGFNKYIPPVLITDLTVYSRKSKKGYFIVHADTLETEDSIKMLHLSHDKYALKIEFTSLSFSNPSKNRFAYQLEGFDDNWQYRDASTRFAYYSNLMPGEYTFKVKAYNSDGLPDEEAEQILIFVYPPWWWSWWAKIFYLLLALTALYFFRKYTLISVNEKHQLKLEHVEKQKSEELNKMKIHFFTDISHELRTPLSLILSPLEGLINAVSKHNIKSQLMLIYRNAEKLYRLVNDLMDLSKSEYSKLDIKVQPGNIVKFTREIFGCFNEMALRQQIEYQFNTKYEEITSWFDMDKLEKIIQNLLSNAFKFTPVKGKIIVSVDKLTTGQLLEHTATYIEGSEYVSISVIDNGAGIAPEYLYKIFDRFYQAPVKEYSNLKGTGVGLALTKSLIELHHGFITVKSHPNTETVFKVFLPLGNSHFNSSEIIEKSEDIDINVVKSKTIDDNYKDKDLKIIKKGNPKIIVIEDNLELREYLVLRLEKNYSVISTDNGRSGYEKIVKYVPDLIVSDILMPEISGIELCKRIRENITICHIPVILLTAKATIDDKIEGIETGADAYVTKPFNLRYLESMIGNLIESRRKLYKRFSQDIYILPKEITTNPLDQELLEKAIKFVHDNISNPDLSVDDLAEFLSMSHRNAYRKIKALTNQSINDFIRSIRLKMAMRLMDERKLTISEIAFDVGFTSHTYFTRCFRKQFGKSPSEYLSGKNTGTEDINSQ